MNSLNLDIRLFNVLFHDLFCDFLLERVGWLERRNIMARYDDSCVLADVACGLLGTGLDDERAEATEIHVFAMREAVFYNSHKLFHNRENGRLIDAGCPRYLVNNICFSHIEDYMVLFKIHIGKPVDAKTNQYSNRKTGESANEHILCNLYVLGFVQFSKSEN